MKKLLSLVVLILFITTLSGCFLGNSQSKQPIPNDNGIVDSGNSDNQEELTNDEFEEPIEDMRDEPEVIRQEIANMLRDAESLIDYKMYDDAKSVLRNLRSRDLTTAEKNKVDELSARLIKISD